MAASLLESKRPSTNANSARSWSSAPQALLVVDDDGRLLFHNARLREILGYSKDELDLCDSSVHWHDLNQRTRIIKQLRDQGGQILNEKAVWRTKSGTLVHLLLSYVQVAYQGGHISFVGGKRVLWVYDVTRKRNTRYKSSSRSASFGKFWTTARRQ